MATKLKIIGRSIRELIQKKLDRSETATRDVSKLTAAAMQARARKKAEAQAHAEGDAA